MAEREGLIRDIPVAHPFGAAIAAQIGCPADLSNPLSGSHPSHFYRHGYFCFTSVLMAEREGFEPSMEFNPHTPLAGERLQPLGHLSGIFN